MTKKNCLFCGKQITKPPKYSYKQFELQKFCSPKCQHAVGVSTETRKKISIIHTGIKLSLEHRKKLSVAKKGKPLSEKALASRFGNHCALGHRLTNEAKMKISKSMLGKRPSPETRDKLSIAQIKRWDKVGRREYGGGLRCRDKKYIIWRMGVFERDNFTCQECGDSTGRNLEAHHIKSWAFYPELRLDLSNGITLCKDCHKLTNNYKNRRNVECL